MTARSYVVFNVEQCTDLEKIPPLNKPTRDIPTNERAERIMAAMKNDGLGFTEHPHHAFYSPGRDEVSLPPRESFKSVEGYYGTALHEIGHATGAAQRQPGRDYGRAPVRVGRLCQGRTPGRDFQCLHGG
ncbi:zincin-like metallopeptidase domain-containing protein [Ferrovum myxofaciens]|uniref:Polyvalent protein metallopeptidase domain-containing protein n=1 Tax=Ferrovum myxofaciens TaxID=416213 RepID=A0A9E6MY92_9PROT|nr:zincin-like metallopeptidase domain-containing protein [Ferrovum myxofaciens]MBU6995977.1 hypothetical protein [Ferrovum myxofaciens]QSH81904.1 MAG: hypothetical protein HO273_13800 [Ferrovum myxofaciens]QWY74926.1 MAG: hypothetical protein JVY19_00320 [Ferrovum myxofaciens]QWY77673.1 MAG: hypothetical protein JZL65_00875 [Ferrovum myxofaciens]